MLVGILVILLLVLHALATTNKKQLLRAIVGDIIGETVDHVAITNTLSTYVESL